MHGNSYMLESFLVFAVFWVCLCFLVLRQSIALLLNSRSIFVEASFDCFFILCVGVVALDFPQVWLRGRLLFLVATFLGACLGVGYTFFFTQLPWLYVETATVWM